MRRGVLGVLFVSAVALGAWGEEGTHHALYLEVGGPGVLYSLNYELRPLAPFALRVGFGYWLLAYTVPLTAHFLLFPGPHHGEVGLGVVIGEFVGSILPPSRPVLEVLLAGHVGYRYHPPRFGLLFRVGFTPLVKLRTLEVLPWGGISLGIAF